MTQTVQGTFIAEKISKIRWRPDQFKPPHIFVTGSWDSNNNAIKLWKCFINNEEDSFPYELSTYNTNGDVTEMKFIHEDLLVVSTSDGSVSLLQIANQEEECYSINEQTAWKQIHNFKNTETCSCTGLAVYAEDFASIGEDGCLNLFTARRETLVRSIENADTCSLHCICFLKFNEVLTGNLRGQMKIWDLRESKNKPMNTFRLNGDQIAATSLTFHPTQRHMVLAGDEEGSLTVWDLRQNTFPVTLLSAHSSAVCEIQFHPSNPEHLFSCSSSGELWHWGTVAQPKQYHTLEPINTMEYVNPWFTNEGIKNKIEVFSLMPKLHKPINSLDLHMNKLLCGCDNEAVYLFNNIGIE